MGVSEDATTISKSNQHIIHKLDIHYKSNINNLQSSSITTAPTSTSNILLLHELNDIRDRKLNRRKKRSESLKSLIDLERFRFIRLFIIRPSTRWGSSVWRLQVWGF